MKDLVGREMTPTERRLLRALKACEAILKEPLAPAIEAIVREHAEIDEFQLVLWNNVDNGREEVSVRVELKPGLDSAWAALDACLAKELAEAHENLRIHVERAGQGELPRFELKAKRVKDERVVKGAPSGKGTTS